VLGDLKDGVLAARLTQLAAVVPEEAKAGGDTAPVSAQLMALCCLSNLVSSSASGAEEDPTVNLAFIPFFRDLALPVT
jgi:hypothetical protein